MNEVQRAEGPLRHVGAGLGQSPARHQHDQHRQDHAECRRQDDRDEGLVEAGPLDPGQSGMGHAGADDPADQRVARRGGNALKPGNHVPEHRPDQRPKDDGRVTRSLSIRPLPIVSATACSCGHNRVRKYAAKLKKAANMTAWTGFSSLVATTVAIELAASWRPFRKSNARARTTRPTSSGRAISCIGVAIDQLWSITMPSISFATSSKASTMRSRCLKISRSTMNSSALLSRCA